MAPSNYEEMEPTSPFQALVLLDYFGIGVFAVSGALVAAEKRTDLVTFIFFAVVAGVGGGTLRDLLIGAPVFWINTMPPFSICMVAALGTWVIRGRWNPARAVLWFDAAGMAAYAAYGSAKALSYGVAPVPAFGMGVLTACAGGIIRDVLANEPSILLRREIYITTAALAAGLLVGLSLLGLSGFVAAGIAVVAGFILRAFAIVRGWSLPAYRG